MKLNLLFKLLQARRTWTSYAVLVATLLLTAFATYYVTLTAKNKDRLRFENAVQRTKSDIQQRLDTYVTVLRTGSGLFAASGTVSLEDFRRYVERLKLQRNYPGIQGVGFSIQIKASEKDNLIANMRQQGFTNFKILPDNPRDTYHAIIYLEPLNQRNQAAIGYDMFTNSVRRAAMERARDKDESAASGKVILVQEIDKNKQAGFLIYVPVYRQGTMPKTVAQRREALLGFVYSPFRADDLMAGIFGKEEFPYVDFEIYDGTEIVSENLLHRSEINYIKNPFFRPRFHTTTTINVAGRPWQIVFTSTPELDRISETRLAPYIPVFGVAFALVLFLLMRSQVTARLAAERSQEAVRRSEERFRRLFDSNLVGIAFWNMKGNVTEANDAYLKIVGYSREEFVAIGSISWRQITPPEYKHLDDRAIEQSLATGVSNIYEKEYLTRDGNRVPIVLGVALLDDSQYNGISVVLDITNLKKAQQALQESEERFQAFMNHTPTAAWITDEDGHLIYHNQTYYRLFSLPTKDLIGKTGLDLYPEELAKTYLENIKMVAETNQVIEAIESAPRLDGTLGDFLVYKFPIYDTDNRCLVGGVAIDITERQRAEEEREKLLNREKTAREEAEAANRMKDEFLATLSHELRTPLNAMLGWTSLLRTRKFNEETTARALETIDRNTRALSQLIEDLLDVSRIMTGKFRMEMFQVNVVSVIVAAVDAVRSAAEAKNIVINTEFKDELCLVSGDHTRLQQIVWNLLSNAIKFTQKEGRVDVYLRRNDSNVEITISDNGQGISPEFLPYIFERFRQADASITRKHGGLGLGLAIVRHLVELHGGTIGVESLGERKGATFIVTLPLRAIRHHQETSDPSFTKSEQYSSDENLLQTSASILNDLWVLVVDDEPDARDLISTVLQDSGAKVTAVASAEEALSVIAKGVASVRPNILISDIGMPEQDGYSLIRKIRKLPAKQGGQIPAAALTAYARAEERERALNAGFHIHIAKPVIPEELVKIIASLAGRN